VAVGAGGRWLLAAAVGFAAAVRAAAPVPGAPAQAEAFPVMEYRVLHNSVLSIRDVERAVYPFLGPNKTLTDVEGARSALERAYHGAGYSSVFVDIPEQAIQEGVVRLSVTEGHVGALHVTGERYVSGRAIRAAVPSLAPGSVPHFPDVQSQINAVNRQSPDLTVVPVLKSGDTPGTLDVNLKVKDDSPLHASVDVNNRYTPDTTPTRLYFNLGYTNLFQTFQSLSLQYQVAPERRRDAEVYSGSYVIPFAPGGPSLAFFAVKTNSDVATVGTLSVVGRGNIYGTRFIVPVTESGGVFQTLTFGTDYKDFGQNVELLGGGAIQTPIHYMNWSADYTVNLTTPHTHSMFETTSDFGVRGLVNNDEEFENNRSQAEPNYFYLKVNALHERLLTHDWSIAIRFNSQYTPEPLISNEQFGIGGVDSVRGYLESEALGDFGFSGAFELRTPPLPFLVKKGAREAYAYLFTDGGMVALIDPLPSQVSRTRMWSWGGGLRLSSFEGFDMGLNVASARLATPYTRDEDVRFLFDIRYGY
jgi:hemolysin activation/secretion protein